MTQEQGGNFRFYMPEDEDSFNMFCTYYAKNMDLIDSILNTLNISYTEGIKSKLEAAEYKKYLDVLYNVITSDMVSLDLTDSELKDCIAKDHYTTSKYYIASAYSVSKAYKDLLSFIEDVKKNSIKQDIQLQSGKSLNDLIFDNV